MFHQALTVHSFTRAVAFVGKAGRVGSLCTMSPFSHFFSQACCEADGGAESAIRSTATTFTPSPVTPASSCPQNPCPPITRRFVVPAWTPDG